MSEQDYYTKKSHNSRQRSRSRNRNEPPSYYDERRRDYHGSECKYWALGNCVRGEKCTFKHDSQKGYSAIVTCDNCHSSGHVSKYCPKNNTTTTKIEKEAEDEQSQESNATIELQKLFMFFLTHKDEIRRIALILGIDKK